MNYLQKWRMHFVFYSMIVTTFLFGPPILHGEEMQAHQVIKISADPWVPWVLGNEGESPTGGWAIDVTRELFRRLNFDTETMIYPYNRCLDQMKTGERDILLMAKKTAERQKYMVFSDVVFTDPQQLYYSTQQMNGFKWEKWEDLGGYTVGIVLGFNYGEFKAASEKHQILTETVRTDIQNIGKLLRDRIDLIILNRSTATHYFDQNPELRGKFKAAPKNISLSEFHFALSKKGKATQHLAAINAVLQEMKTEGLLDKLSTSHE